MKFFTVRSRFTIEAANADATKQRRFSILAYSGGLLNVDGFPLPVVVDLQGLKAAPNVPILIDHNKSVEATLGETDSYQNTGSSVILSGPITGTSAQALKVVSQADAGHHWQASIGARVEQEEEIQAGQSVMVNGRTFVGPIIVARRALLRETSVLPVGADPTTSVNLAATSAGLLQGAAIMTFEQWLASLGLDPNAISDTDRQALMSAFDAIQNPVTPTPPVAPPAATPAPGATLPQTAAAGALLNLTAGVQAQLQAANQQFAANFRRVSEIQAKCAGYPAIAAAAIENPAWTMDKVELEIMKAQNARVRPTSFTKSEKELPAGEVLEAAVSMARKHKDHEKAYKPEVLQAAQSEYREIGLKQIFLVAAIANGYQNHGHAGVNRGNVGEVLRFATRGGNDLEAAFSTVSLPGILSNIANKEILDGYMEEDQVWRQVAKVKSVSDFKAVTSYRMLDNVEYEELGPGGKIKSGSLDEESYTRQAKTYAKMFSLTRTDIINDDLGAFDDLRDRIGRGSGKKMNKVFWTKFLNNSAFYTAALTNYISGSTSNLGTDGVGLGLAVTAFRKMTSPATDDAKRVGAGATPKLLVVPPELEFNADKLWVSSNLNVGSAAGEENVFVKKYQPVVVWQLSDAAYSGNSATAFYLLGDPSSMPVIVVSFLGGVEVPTVDTSESDFNTLGVLFRGYHDFGCDSAEYLGGVKSKGAA